MDWFPFVSNSEKLALYVEFHQLRTRPFLEVIQVALEDVCICLGLHLPLYDGIVFKQPCSWLDVGRKVDDVDEERRGPSTLLCGTPDRTLVVADVWPLSITCWVLFWRKDVIHSSMFPRSSHFSTFCSNRRCGTLSNASQSRAGFHRPVPCCSGRSPYHRWWWWADFCRSVASKSIFAVCEDVVRVKVLHDIAVNGMLHEFRAYGGQWDWSVVEWCGSVTFLEDWEHICSFSIRGTMKLHPRENSHFLQIHCFNFLQVYSPTLKNFLQLQIVYFSKTYPPGPK